MELRDIRPQPILEDIVDAELPILDAHHHLWRADGPASHQSYDYLEADFQRDLDSGHRVIATVAVECRSWRRPDGPEHLRFVGETDWLDGAGERAIGSGTEVAAAIVAYADLSAEATVDEVLDAHQAAAPRRLRGIRQSSTWSDDPAVIGRHPVNPPHRLLDPAFRRGFARLAPRGLSYEAWLYHPQLPELTDLARSFPQTTIVLDHLGGPLGAGRYAPVREEVFAQWRQAIGELARCPNVYLKLGGAAMHMFGFGWRGRAVPPGSDELVAAAGHFYRAAIDTFSPARCMFESNFPVDRECCSYAGLWNSFKKIAAGYSPAERTALFSGTAARAYRLPQFQG
jgi:L-fuconolactonase